MPNEASKAIARRRRDPRYAERYFVGEGIDVGAGGDGLSHQAAEYPRMVSCREWDMPDGDAQFLATVPDNAFDFLHSSHCLEHVRDPYVAMTNWVRVVKPGGFLVVVVPDEDMYEQGIFPSTFNGDHKFTFTTCWKKKSWSPASIAVESLLIHLNGVGELVALDKNDEGYNWGAPRMDQTGGPAACAIEFVVRKRHPLEIDFGGRVGQARTP